MTRPNGANAPPDGASASNRLSAAASVRAIAQGTSILRHRASSAAARSAPLAKESRGGKPVRVTWQHRAAAEAYERPIEALIPIEYAYSAACRFQSGVDKRRIVTGLAQNITRVVGGHHRTPALASVWPHALVTAVAFVLAPISAFAHSRDGYTAVVPTGLTLSGLAAGSLRHHKSVTSPSRLRDGKFTDARLNLLCRVV
jgi:hypothetical protein